MEGCWNWRCKSSELYTKWMSRQLWGHGVIELLRVWSRCMLYECAVSFVKMVPLNLKTENVNGRRIKVYQLLPLFTKQTGTASRKSNAALEGSVKALSASQIQGSNSLSSDQWCSALLRYHLPLPKARENQKSVVANDLFLMQSLIQVSDLGHF